MAPKKPHASKPESVPGTVESTTGSPGEGTQEPGSELPPAAQVGPELPPAAQVGPGEVAGDATLVDTTAEARIDEEKALSEKATAVAKEAEEKAATAANAAQEQHDKEWAAVRAQAVLTLMKCGLTHEQAVAQVEEAKEKLHALTAAEREELFAATIRDYEEEKRKAAAGDTEPPAETMKRCYSTSHVRIGEERLEIGTCLDSHFSKEQLDRFVAEGHAEWR